MKLCVIFALFVIFIACDPTRASPSRVRRQGWNWGGDNDDTIPVRPTRQTTPTTPLPSGAPVSSTEASAAQFETCTAGCTATQEYNPVCGTNRITYGNIGKLKCAKRCGVDVESSFTGTCSPAPAS